MPKTVDPFLQPHEWERDKEGRIRNYELWDIHDGPRCIRCDEYFCQHCERDIYHKPCPEQDEGLIPITSVFTEVQMARRFKWLYENGYRMRNGVIFGRWASGKPERET